MSVVAWAACEVSGPQPRPAPIAIEELGAAFAGLESYSRLVLAVSGGADSTALMQLTVDWARHAAIPLSRLLVVTVDHGLRAASASEAAGVAAAAAALGLAHLTKTAVGHPPAQPSQAWARDLRYRLLVDAARSGVDADARVALLTAHHQDDQAETVLMRLARGSGVDGLAAIRPRRPFGTVDLVRPLLSFPKHRLIATLRDRAASWIEDPSNCDNRFERAQLRGVALGDERQRLSPAHLALTARRMARAADALEACTLDALANPAMIAFRDLGYVDLDWAALLRHPPEVRLRVLSRALSWLNPDPVSLGQLEALTEARGWLFPAAGFTLHRSRLLRPGANVHIVREPARMPTVPIRAEEVVRCGPFCCRLREPAHHLPGLSIGPVGLRGIAFMRGEAAASEATADHQLPDVPAHVLAAQPALFCDGRPLSAPVCGYRPELLRVVLADKPSRSP